MNEESPEVKRLRDVVAVMRELGVSAYDGIRLRPPRPVPPKEPVKEDAPAPGPAEVHERFWRRYARSSGGRIPSCGPMCKCGAGEKAKKANG